MWGIPIPTPTCRYFTNKICHGQQLGDFEFSWTSTWRQYNGVFLPPLLDRPSSLAQFSCPSLEAVVNYFVTHTKRALVPFLLDEDYEKVLGVCDVGLPGLDRDTLSGG